MESFEILSKKIKQAAEKIGALRLENEKLQSEIKFLEQEGTRSKEVEAENINMRDEKKAIAFRIEKLIKKINSIKTR